MVAAPVAGRMVGLAVVARGAEVFCLFTRAVFVAVGLTTGDTPGWEVAVLEDMPQLLAIVALKDVVLQSVGVHTYHHAPQSLQDEDLG